MKTGKPIPQNGCSRTWRPHGPPCRPGVPESPAKPGIVSALSVLLLAACVFFPGCEANNTDGPYAPPEAAETMETEENVMNEPAESTAKQEPLSGTPSYAAPEDADWPATVRAAADRANGVNGRFTDAGRKKFLVTNGNMSLLYDLTTDGRKGVESICSPDGVPYIENTSDARIVLPDGTRCGAAYSPKNGRMNSHRLGYYYYDFRFCDQIFVNGEALRAEGGQTYDILKHAGTWGTHDTSSVRKEGGMMSYTVTSAYDPYVYASVRFQAADYDAVRLTIRAGAASVGEIFIISGGHDGYSAEQRTSLAVTPGEWTTVTVPLSVIPDYAGTVRGFRIDVGAEAGELVEISEIAAVRTGASSVPFALERIYHTYPDKVHEVLRIVATDTFEGGGRFETETAIPSENVGGILLKNASGESSSLDGFSFATAEFVAFDIRDAGIWGVIMPNLKDNGDIRVDLRDGYYIVTRGIDLKTKIRKGKDAVFGQRLYASAEHDFDGIRREAEIERNPLTEIRITDASDGAKFEGYDPLAGFYRFTVDSSDFNRAYYREPDKQYAVPMQIGGDGVSDRTVYIRAAEARGNLECGAVLDEKGVLLPIPVEVTKNFCGEYEEPLFDPLDPAYGEVYFPVTVGPNEQKRLTVLHLYQNWGNYPLKQLSSIAFHIPYYHLSVGVTETNCIAPYFVYGKDGWTLPDFRANSAPLWSGQPQHTSAGRLYFLRYTDAEGNSFKSESQSAEIVSAGPVYADVTMEYLSDDGKIKATYRHAETAQTDENRTYYSILLEVLDDVTIRDFRRDFSFFTFDGRSVYYKDIGYLGENNQPVAEKVRKGERIVTLGSEFPYYDYFNGNVKDSVNFALIVRDSAITVGGAAYDGPFVLYDRADDTLNTGSLSLDLGEVTLKKGDRMELEIILLPWGYSTSRNDANVLAVREDSCLNPVRLTVLEGEAVADRFIPSVRASDNRASFRLSGGKGTAAVRVYGFGSCAPPRVTVGEAGEETVLALAGKNGYDGYQVYADGDGTYSFSFNVDLNGIRDKRITVEIP